MSIKIHSKRSVVAFAIFLILASYPVQARGKDKVPPTWKIGHIMDESRAREFAGMYHNRQSATTNSGSVSATATSTDYGYGANTSVNGSYSGTSSTSTSGFDAPMYRVYENLIVEGDDVIYVTSERLVWRWSKGPKVTVNGQVKYYVDGSKLHLIDDEGKEKTIPIVRAVRKVPTPPVATPVASTNPRSSAITATSASLTISSNPSGADILIDGSFMGNTPSTIETQPGDHDVKLTKSGYQTWERTLKTTTGTISVSPDLLALPPQQ